MKPTPTLQTDLPAGDVCTISEQCFGDMECDRETCFMEGGQQGATCDFSRPNGEGNLMCNIGFYCAEDSTCQPLERKADHAMWMILICLFSPVGLVWSVLLSPPTTMATNTNSVEHITHNQMAPTWGTIIRSCVRVTTCCHMRMMTVTSSSYAFKPTPLMITKIASSLRR